LECRTNKSTESHSRPIPSELKAACSIREEGAGASNEHIFAGNWPHKLERERGKNLCENKFFHQEKGRLYNKYACAQRGVNKGPYTLHHELLGLPVISSLRQILHVELCRSERGLEIKAGYKRIIKTIKKAKRDVKSGISAATGDRSTKR
jgi:hypothetical protein